MQRRGFLKWSLLSSMASGWPISLRAKSSRQCLRDNPIPFSILQGATDETRTQFSILHSQEEPLSFLVTSARGQLHWPDHVEQFEFSGQPQTLVKAYFSDLSLHESYRLLVVNGNETVLEERFFQTLDLNKDRLRFTVASCMDDNRHEPAIWQDMVAQNPDLILFVGDSVYADRLRGAEERVTADPELLWRRFCEARQTLEIYNSPQLIPILATWDDHDFGKNDTGNSYPYIVESQRNFQQFFAQEGSHCRGLVSGPGVGFALALKNQTILLLDNRSFRSKGDAQNPHGHWGLEQMQWLTEVCEDRGGFVWVCNGSQVFPQMLFKESVSKEHPVNLDELTQFFKSRQQRAAFISGDVHYSEISRLESDLLGYQSYELTSSSIHSQSFPGVPGIIPNRRRIASTGRRNYLMVDAQTQGEGMRMRVTSRSAGDRVNFEKELVVGSCTGDQEGRNLEC
jgi:hypothetical protein